MKGSSVESCLQVVSDAHGSLLMSSTITDILSRQTFVQQVLTHLCTSLNDARMALDSSQWVTLLEQLHEHPLKQLLLKDPFTKRVHDKPRGFAGDAKMLDYLYFCVEDVTLDPIGADVQLFLCGSPAGFAVRERATIIGEVMDGMLQHRGTRRLRVLSVACGHARELFLSKSFLQDRISFTGLDVDLKSLQTLRDTFSGFDVTTLHWPVKKILNRDSEILSIGQFDFIYSCGLYDYLSDKTASNLTEIMFNDLLQPGGKLVVANFMDHFIRGYMEAFMKWNLIYRDMTELSNIAKSIAPASKAIRVFKDSSSVIAFLEVDKQLADNTRPSQQFKRPAGLRANL